MPVQAKNGFAALLSSDDLPSAGVQPSSKDDSDKTDFGAALGGLVAAMFASAPSDPATARKTGAASAIDETSTVINDTNSHRAAATPVSTLTSNEISSPALAALFESTFGSALSDPNAAKSTGHSTAKTASDPSATPQLHATDRSVAPAALSDSASAPGLPQAKPAAATVADADPASTESLSMTAADAPAAAVSIKIEKTPAAAFPQHDSAPSQTASHDQHTDVAPAASAPGFEHAASLFTSSAAPAAAASQPQPEEGGPRDSATVAKSSGADASTLNTSAKDTGAPVAQPATSASMNAPVSAPIQIAARAASAYREASAAIAPTKTQPTTRRSDQIVDTVGSPQTSSASDAAAPKVAEAAQIRQILDAVSNAPAARVANVKVDLADGQSAQAMVRERAGNVDVKIIAPGADSARHISGEVDSLRSALEGAGLHLGHSEVSYQGNSGERGREQRETAQDSNRPANQSNEVFTLTEVNE